MRQAIAQARHGEMIEKARNDGWIDGRMDNNDGSWTPGQYKFPAYKSAYHEGLSIGSAERKQMEKDFDPMGSL